MIEKMIEIDVKLDGEVFEFSSPNALFQAPWDTGRTYGVSPKPHDGKPTFFFLDSDDRTDAPISIILNWHTLLASHE